MKKANADHAAGGLPVNETDEEQFIGAETAKPLEDEAVTCGLAGLVKRNESATSSSASRAKWS